MLRRIAILGSTGSIGRQTLEVIEEVGGLQVCALAAGRNWQLLAKQAQQFKPACVALAEGSPEDFKALASALPAGTKLLQGSSAMTELVACCKPQLLLSGVVGAAGLAPTLEAIKCGADIAIANKETLVMAGALVIPAANAAGVNLLPVDSEHSAIFQCLMSGKRSEVHRVCLTASGGALRDRDEASAAAATVDEALNHPTWSMGRKITIDSATLMNKALEIVEAHWLFDLSAAQIGVLLHPESVIHSMVEFCDGSVVAQMGPPDMKTPIAYALYYPNRPARKAPQLDLAAAGKLTFRPLPMRFKRAIELGYEVIRQGGLSGAVLNAANEAAVEAFLAGKIALGRVVSLVEDILNRAPRGSDITVDALLEADAWARLQVKEAISRS